MLPRQPFFAVWSLDELPNRDAAVAIPELRAELADLLGDMLKRQLVGVDLVIGHFEATKEVAKR